MNKYKYRLYLSGCDIEKFNIISETEKTITYNKYGVLFKPKRENKISSIYLWFDTFDEAKIKAINITERRIINLQNQLLEKTNKLESLKGLKDE